MRAMAWEALPSAAIGAVIALSGTLMADVRRDRRQRARDRDVDRRKYSIDFAVALARGHGALRVAAGIKDEAERKAAVTAAMEPLYVVREQLLVSGSARIVVAGEEAFHRLVGVRDVVRAGGSVRSAEYHEVYHAFADAIWHFRLAIRDDLNEPALAPGDLDRPDWTERETCAICAGKT